MSDKPNLVWTDAKGSGQVTVTDTTSGKSQTMPVSEAKEIAKNVTAWLKK